MATDIGLFYYNGKSYEKIRNSNQLGLSVFNFRKDEKGKVWCNNLYAQFFYVENNELKLALDLKNIFKGATFLPDFAISNDILSVINKGKAVFFDLKTKEIVFEKDEIGLELESSCIKNYKNDSYIIIDSLYKINHITNRIKGYEINTKEKHYNRLFEIEEELYCFQSETKSPEIHKDKYEAVLYKFYANKGVSKNNLLPIKLQDKHINSIKKIDDLFFFCTNEGLYIYNYKDDLFVFKEVLFKGFFTTQVIKDYKGNIVVATLKNGLYVIPSLKIRKEKLNKNLNNVNSFFFHGDKVIYLNSNGEFFEKNILNNKSFSNSITNRVTEIKWAKRINDKHVYVYGTNGGLIWNLDKNEFKNVSYIIANKDVSYREIDSTLFISNSQSFSIKKIDLESSFFNQYIDTTLYEGRSWFNFLSSKGDVYTALSNKLYRFKENFLKEEVEFNGDNIQANFCTETSDGTIWVGTINQGLLKIDTNLNQVSKEENLKSNRFYKVIADKFNLWSLDDDYISYHDRENEKVFKFNYKKELQTKKIIDFKVYKDKLYVLSNKEVITIDKKLLETKIGKQRIFISKIYSRDKELPIKRKYKIPYTQNQLEIHYNTIGYNINEDVFEYRLKGLDKKWKTSIETNVKYSYIPNGKYVFQIRTVNSKNGKYGESQSINITIEKPYWLTWWFISLLVSIVVLILYFIIWRIRKGQSILYEKEKLNRDLISYKLENLRSQMNPHFIFNTLNSIQGYIITNKKKEASIYLAEFSDLIRMYLDFSRKEFTALSEEIKAIKLYLKLEQVRIGESFTYEVNSEVEKSTEDVYLPSLFIQPYIENAILHGLVQKKESKELIITFKYNNKTKDQLECIIEDNGIGREAAMKLKKIKSKYHKSYALNANHNRIDLLNKNKKEKVRIEIIDKFSNENNPIGTKVIIKIPQKNESSIN
ncbi:putative Two component regulator propeller [Tenacibaculum sp. 190524A02b]|uniref:Two component regulator propeller n=1 Tax=Tenacibaculum vairaonense TaxID=3137860 RepID=A0ABP1F848_9FLAO